MIRTRTVFDGPWASRETGKLVVNLCLRKAHLSSIVMGFSMKL
jgi:hypothetical protein